MVDEDTYVQQGRDLERAYSLQVINYILGTLQPDTDLAMVGYPFTDEVSHQFMGLVTPTDADGEPNPCYDVNPKFDDVQCTGRGTADRVAIREGYIRSAYADADEKLGITRELMGGNPTTFAGSDHGFAPQWYAVNANARAEPATVGGVSLHASGGGASNCSAVGGAPVAPPTAPIATTTSRRRAGPAGRSRSTSTRTGSGTRRSRPRRASRRTRRFARRSATRSRPSPTRRTRASRSSSRS